MSRDKDRDDDIMRHGETRAAKFERDQHDFQGYYRIIMNIK
jgi:hypothetical protein